MLVVCGSIGFLLLLAAGIAINVYIWVQCFPALEQNAGTENAVGIIVLLHLALISYSQPNPKDAESQSTSLMFTCAVVSTGLWIALIVMVIETTTVCKVE